MWQSEVRAGTNWTSVRGPPTCPESLVFVYFLLTGRSRELTIGEGA